MDKYHTENKDKKMEEGNKDKKNSPPSSPQKRKYFRCYFLDDMQMVASQNVIDETNRLYIYLLAGQISRAGLSFPYEDKEYLIIPHYVSSFQILANQFIVSPQRKWVYEQAESIDLNSLNFLTFQELMRSFFQEGGKTWERVLELFYFCADLSVRALQETVVGCFIRIFNYTTYYISNILSVRVEQEGGWGVVLQTSADYTNNFLILGVCAIGVLLVYMCTCR